MLMTYEIHCDGGCGATATLPPRNPDGWTFIRVTVPEDMSETLGVPVNVCHACAPTLTVQALYDVAAARGKARAAEWEQRVREAAEADASEHRTGHLSIVR